MLLKYCEGEPLPPEQAAATMQPMLKAAVKRPELRDEFFLQVRISHNRHTPPFSPCVTSDPPHKPTPQPTNQLVKQSRGRPSPDCGLSRVWQLLQLLCCTAPPSRECTPFISEFLQTASNDHTASALGFPAAVQAAAASAWDGLRKVVKHGARRSTPSQEQIVAHLSNHTLNTICFFLDETFEEVPYGLCTTVADASKQVAAAIGLTDHQTFSIFEARKVGTKELKEGAAAEEHVSLSEGRYVADIMHQIRTLAAKSDAPMSRLVFKKRLFRDADEGITEPVFISLSYVQAQHDYLGGQYPVTREDACQLAALMMLGDMGPVHLELESPEQVSF